MNKIKTLTQHDLITTLSYSKDTGLFLWNKTGSGRSSVVGHVNSDGYLDIHFNGSSYSAHRLAWLYVTGFFPKGQIDHIDQDRLNNKWLNLRDVSRSENLKNSRIGSRNRSGVLGVYWNKKLNKWHSKIWVSGKNITLGYYSSKSEAAKSRSAANKLYGFHENHGSKRSQEQNPQKNESSESLDTDWN